MPHAVSLNPAWPTKFQRTIRVPILGTEGKDKGKPIGYEPGGRVLIFEKPDQGLPPSIIVTDEEFECLKPDLGKALIETVLPEESAELADFDGPSDLPPVIDESAHEGDDGAKGRGKRHKK